MQPPALISVPLSKLLTIKSNCVLESSKDEDLTTSLDNLLHCLITLVVKKHFNTFKLNFFPFSLCPLPPILLLNTLETSLAPSSVLLSARYFILF